MQGLDDTLFPKLNAELHLSELSDVVFKKGATVGAGSGLCYRCFAGHRFPPPGQPCPRRLPPREGVCFISLAYSAPPRERRSHVRSQPPSSSTRRTLEAPRGDTCRSAVHRTGKLRARLPGNDL